MRRTRAIALALGLAVAGCGGPPAPAVDLGAAWPARGGDYAEVTERWTRSDEFRADFTLKAHASATFKSAAWRAAYVEQRAAREGLSAEGRATLVAAEKKAAGEAHEVQLMLTTYDRRSNDLAKRTRSIWRITLVGDDGKEVEPLEVLRDRRPRDEIKAYFPELGDFAQPYLVRFPADAGTFGGDSRTATLRIASGQGALELAWRER